ncbi:MULTISPECIES: DUF4395 family protein [unclassified Microbacterium]|uniref:DUF4395 family protein n=1 Tax=unclassified Microbacterium TaxID=2609290 RepID=UPI000EA9B8A1|nr:MULTISPECIES: DUF4395 family protein [unclassified Microbacterium]MBT2485599.1 DUF4395 domain-containing protein [Microbacterium sp. ISL-108]RKN68380.1 DUF4395 family protein [Microbacterium sp. CGR2]
MTTSTGIDPRGPRFAAAMTALLLLVATFLALVGISTARLFDTYVAFAPGFDFAVIAGRDAWAIQAAPLLQRALDPGFLLAVIIALLFLWGVVSPTTAPWSILFRRLVRPRLAGPTELEDPRPPRFFQGVGLFVVGAGLVLHLLGVPWALPVATAAAFVAAFLNAAFAFCLGCRLYLLLQRAGVVGRAASAS